MTALLVLAVAVGAAVGAPLRWWTERMLVRVAGTSLPWGTLIVNVVGSAIAGVVLGSARAGGLSEVVLVLLATGFCGALTTFGGFAAQILDLTSGSISGSDATRSLRGVAYALVSVLLGVVVAALGYALAS